jgi:hypothetical protein
MMTLSVCFSYTHTVSLVFCTDNQLRNLTVDLRNKEGNNLLLLRDGRTVAGAMTMRRSPEEYPWATTRADVPGRKNQDKQQNVKK